MKTDTEFNLFLISQLATSTLEVIHSDLKAKVKQMVGEINSEELMDAGFEKSSTYLALRALAEFSDIVNQWLGESTTPAQDLVQQMVVNRTGFLDHMADGATG